VKIILFAAALSFAGVAAAQTVVAPDNSAPERDARGIPVISAPATTPEGYNRPPQTVPAGTLPPTLRWVNPTLAGRAPACSRSITDRCTQIYERPICPNRFNPRCPKTNDYELGID